MVPSAELNDTDVPLRSPAALGSWIISPSISLPILVHESLASSEIFKLPLKISTLCLNLVSLLTIIELFESTPTIKSSLTVKVPVTSRPAWASTLPPNVTCPEPICVIELPKWIPLSSLGILYNLVYPEPPPFLELPGAPIATMVPSELSDTDHPLSSSLASPSISSPIWVHEPSSYQ